MPYAIFPPASNNKILKLGSWSTPTPTALTANTAADIVAVDANATYGRLVHLNNTSTTHDAKVALGRTATDSNYDFILYKNSQLLEVNTNEQIVSAISTGTPTIIATVANYEAV